MTFTFTVSSSTSAHIGLSCASLPGRRRLPAARARPRSSFLLSLRSLRFNRRRILSCALLGFAPHLPLDTSAVLGRLLEHEQFQQFDVRNSQQMARGNKLESARL